MLHLRVKTYEGAYTAELEPEIIPERADAHPEVQAEIATLNRLREIAAAGPASTSIPHALPPIEKR